MRILIVGGTRFIGRHVSEVALDRGHDVTLFHRGRTGPDLFPGADHRIGDRNDDLSALADGDWDATVDMCAFYPRQVQSLADALDGRGGHHLLVSSVSAYASPDGPGITEDAALAELDDPTVEQVTDATYGGLKVLCERAAAERHGPDTIVVRPTYVIGPDDYTWRFPWWVHRIAQGGQVLAPGPADVPAQVVDVRDMAAWMVGLLEQRQSGAFHAASPPPPWTWREELEAIADAVAPPGTTLTWVDPDVVSAAGLPEGTLPLWGGERPDWILAADPAKAYATGLRPRPLAETIRDTLTWTKGRTPPAGVGLSAAQETQLLADHRRG